MLGDNDSLVFDRFSVRFDLGFVKQADLVWG